MTTEELNELLQIAVLNEETFLRIKTAILDLSASSVKANYKEYIALLTQTGTDAPVATIINNTFDEVPSWVRVESGIYALVFTRSVNRNKTVATCNEYTLSSLSNTTEKIVAGWGSENAVFVACSFVERSSGIIADPTDNLLFKHVFTVRIYD